MYLHSTFMAEDFQLCSLKKICSFVKYTILHIITIIYTVTKETKINIENNQYQQSKANNDFAIKEFLITQKKDKKQFDL